MDKDQNLTAWMTGYRRCGGVRKLHPLDAVEHPLIRPVGSQCVEAVYDEWGIELPVGIEEVAKLVKTEWPEDLSWKVEEVEGAYRFKDPFRFKTVMFYLLARLGGAKKTEAVSLVRRLAAKEGECLVESLYDLMFRCRLAGHNCEKLVPTYAKIARSFAEVLPVEKRRGGGGNTA
jgi:hypothetical protein